MVFDEKSLKPGKFLLKGKPHQTSFISQKGQGFDWTGAMNMPAMQAIRLVLIGPYNQIINLINQFHLHTAVNSTN